MPVPSEAEAEVLSELGAATLAEYIDYAIAQTFDDTIYQITDLPNFVADTNPVSPAANVSRQATRLACRAWARGGGPQNLPGFDAAWAGICTPYLESIGEDPSGGSLAPPFTGGQCYTGYSYTYTFRNPNTGELQDSAQTVSGRIVGLFERVNANGFTKSGGIERQLSPGAPVDRIPLGTTNVGASLDQSISNVQRIDGQPDNCGNPPVIYDPPRVRPGLPVVPREPIDFPGIGPIDIEVDFDPDGNINIDLPDVGVDLTVEDPFGLRGDGDGEPGGGGGPPPGDVGSPSDPVSIGPGGEAEGEAPEGSVLTGVRVQIVGIPENRSRYTDEVYRGAYYVYMGVPGLLDHDPAGAMARVDQFVFAEQPNLTAWRVRANSRYELITTPYYRPVEG